DRDPGDSRNQPEPPVTGELAHRLRRRPRQGSSEPGFCCVFTHSFSFWASAAKQRLIGIDASEPEPGRGDPSSPTLSDLASAEVGLPRAAGAPSVLTTDDAAGATRDMLNRHGA